MASFHLAFVWGFRNISESVQELVPPRYYKWVPDRVTEPITVLRSAFLEDNMN